MKKKKTDKEEEEEEGKKDDDKLTIHQKYDKFFHTTFSVTGTVISYLRGLFSKNEKDIAFFNGLQLNSFRIDNTKYVSSTGFKSKFPDILYDCRHKNGDIKIAFLFEHKSDPVGFPHIQLLQYK